MTTVDNISEVAIIENEVSQSENVLAVISRAATDKDVDISKMERLLDMQERVMSKEAEMAFFADMSALQDVMPTIKKEGEIRVKGELRSRYARFEDILGQTKSLLREYGFSVAFKSNFIDGQLEVTGTLSHQAGHHESTTMRLPFDDSGSKNKVQMIGSSVSYGKRYVYCMLLNINISEDDDDGNAADTKNSPEKLYERVLSHMEVVRENLPSVMAIKDGITMEDLSSASEAWFELDDITKRGLWVAPTKGGIFTTKEREIIHSNIFRDAHYGAKP
jgi:hypothetical protein